MKRLKIKSMIAFIIISAALFHTGADSYPQSSGKTYYVSTTGSDKNPGTLKMPFASVVEASKAVMPGDTVYIRGGVYPVERQFGIYTSGTKTKRISYKAYPGEEPVFDGSRKAENWERYQGEIYCGKVSFEALPIIDEEVPEEVSSVASMKEGTYCQEGNTLYIWCNGGSSPESHKLGLLKKFQPDRIEPYGLHITGDYLDFEGITIINCSSDAIGCMGKEVSFRACTVKQCLQTGISVYSDNVNIKDCKVYGNVLMNWPEGSFNNGNGGWGMGISFHSGKNCSAEKNLVFNNHGEGIGTLGGNGKPGSLNLRIIRNTVHDNWGANIWLDHATNPLVDSNLIFSSSEKLETVSGSKLHTSTGIMCAEEKPYGNAGDLRGAVVSNNFIINCNSSFLFWFNQEGSGLRDFLVANNTFVSQNNTDALILIDKGNHKGSVFKNNIVFSRSSSNNGILLRIVNPGNTLFDNNCWYNGNRLEAFRWNNFDRPAVDFFSWCDSTGAGKHNMWAEPVFESGTGLGYQGYVPGRNSPCIDSGAPVPAIRNDYCGNSRCTGKSTDIGAFESKYTAGKPTGFGSLPVPASLIKNGGFEKDIKGTWKLATSPGVAAAISRDGSRHPEGKYSIRADVKNGGPSDYYLQLKQVGVCAKKGKPYLLQFKAMADSDMNITLNFFQDKSPYKNYGLYKSISVGKTWRNYRILFTSNSSTGNDSRFSFMFGNNTGTVWIDNISMIPYISPAFDS